LFGQAPNADKLTLNLPKNDEETKSDAPQAPLNLTQLPEKISETEEKKEAFLR